MRPEVSSCLWSLPRLGEAMELLARQSGLSPRAVELTPPPSTIGDSATWERWIEIAAGNLGLVAEPRDTSYGNVNRLLGDISPALLQIPNDGEPGFLALIRTRGNDLMVLAPDRSMRRLSGEAVRAALCAPIEAPRIEQLDRVLDRADIPDRSRHRARTALLHEQLSETRITGCWMLRLSPGSSFLGQLRRDGHIGRMFGLVAAHTVQYLLWVASWWLVGRGALQGRIDSGWLMAWALVLLTLIPFRMYVTWAQGVMAIGIGGLLKKRLLHGVLRLPQDEIRHQGSGQLLGRVIESEAVESLALSGGLISIVAIVELIVAGVVLTLGSGGGLHLFLLIAWAALTVGIAFRYLRHHRAWTNSRLDMTHDLIERMVGYRTRLVQQAPAHWHDGEDHALEQYYLRSIQLDRSASMLTALVPRGWLVVGLLGLAFASSAGGDSTTALAVGIGGMFLAYRAFDRLAAGTAHLIGAVVAWERVAPIFQAAATEETHRTAEPADLAVDHVDASTDGRVVMEMHGVSFRYGDRGDAVLDGCDLTIRAGDRVLLEGPSGCGKSTLASLLVGLREPDSGLLMLNGLDRPTIGPDSWRRRVVAAPQFHENHILTGTLAFNLLMGRRWPARDEDLREAETLCHELGLGVLLERMPAGLFQMVGESGWQLSQGERSRIYMARALLQNAELVVLDESFAALDPETLRSALRCVLSRAPALLVIAHP